MSLVTRISLLLAVILANACATSPSQDSDFVIHGEEPEGPGVFSGADGKIVLFEDATTSKTNQGDSASPAADISASDWEEFSAFKRWLRSRQTRDASYQEFLQWRQFEAYRNWQGNQ